jgi:hypothetical protein
MEEMLSRGWGDLIARDSGPLHARLVLQPLVATVVAIRAGWRTAGEDRPAFFPSLLRGPAKRYSLLREAWKDVGKVFVVAVVVDVVYQIIVFRWVYPVQTLIVATMLAIVPYLVVRGPTNRITSQIRPRLSSDKGGVSQHDPGNSSKSGPGGLIK